FAFYGGTHGEAMVEAADELLPGSALPLGLGVAGAGAVLAVLPTRKVGSVLGWVAAVALIAMFGAGLVAFFSDLNRGLGGFGRAIMDAIYDAPSSGAWSGALAGEIAMAAMFHVLPPLAASGGIDGAWQAEAQAPTTKKQAATALLGPLFYAILTTVVGLSLVATNAFTRPIEDARPIRELTFYRTAFDSTSQRLEESRLYTGFIRATDGDTGVVEVDVATDRGMVRTPTYEDAGEPANVALHVVDGDVDGLQKPGQMNALQNRPLSELRELRVRGRMLPEGGKLLAASMNRGGGPVIARVALAALLLLAVLGAAAWGLGVRKTLRVRLPDATARWAAVLPALGLGVAAMGWIPGFGGLGILAAGVLTALSSIALVVRAKDASELVFGRPKGAGAKPEKKKK
ncbi:MAG TPA: hypothetical protein RMH99_21750, partial [Sandaracinaceae bacterium LLY-WYZ-13_1]|nr:hypothetical protein [Sandaracinaceae bacterium LLY-WYZ-13_1]